MNTGQLRYRKCPCVNMPSYDAYPMDGSKQPLRRPYYSNLSLYIEGFKKDRKRNKERLEQIHKPIKNKGKCKGT
jgi:hypothetical protein